jgi:RNA-directed DNA polymerase
MDLKSDQRQHIQMELDFSYTRAGEACGTGREEIESPLAAHGTESPANTNRWMEEVCERDNLKEASRQVKANKGSAGIDRHPDGAGSIDSASGNAGSAKRLGSDVL